MILNLNSDMFCNTLFLRNVFEFHSLVIFIRELPYFLKNRQMLYLSYIYPLKVQNYSKIWFLNEKYSFTTVCKEEDVF